MSIQNAHGYSRRATVESEQTFFQGLENDREEFFSHLVTGDTT